MRVKRPMRARSRYMLDFLRIYFCGNIRAVALAATHTTAATHVAGLPDY